MSAKHITKETFRQEIENTEKTVLLGPLVRPLPHGRPHHR